MLNKIIADTIPYFPKKFIWMFSKRYVAGENMDDGIKTSRELNQKGILVTVDLLGEFIHTIKEAETNKNEYLKIIDRFTAENIIGNFSVKPTSFGLLIDKENCYRFIREVITKAASTGNFVRIDMEDATCTSPEIELFLRLKEEFPKNVGLVLQAYLKRTPTDIENMIVASHSKEFPLNFRLCKGIYIESEDIAYKDFHEIRHHYLMNLDRMLRNGIYTAIATHDPYLVDEAMELIKKHNVPKERYEFQMLYGVAPALRDKIVASGHTMRIYVPFGKDWFGYCSRRLKENPKMVNDIIRSMFVRG
jgi:proline dehydrogenase